MTCPLIYETSGRRNGYESIYALPQSLNLSDVDLRSIGTPYGDVVCKSRQNLKWKDQRALVYYTSIESHIPLELNRIQIQEAI